MMAVQFDQLLLGDEPHPHKQRLCRLAEIFRKATHDLDIRLLDHVGFVETTSNPGIEPKTDDSS